MIRANEPAPFTRLRGAGRLAPGSSLTARTGRYEVAVFNVGGEVFALENSCPHQGGPLADGWLRDGFITCPWHGWCFDVRTGRMSLGDFARVARFEVVRDGADLLIATEPMAESQ